MIKMEVNGKEYIIQYGFNSFCDTDILDRVSDMVKTFQNAEVKSDADATSSGMLKELFVTTRELLFIGMEKKNPLSDVRDAGNLLDDYRDEAPDGEERSLMSIFGVLTEEIIQKGFLSDLMAEEKSTKK